MPIIDCVEDVADMIDHDLKNEDLRDYLKIKGNVVLLASTARSKMYAFKSFTGKFYINMFHDINVTQVHVRIFEAPTFGDLLKRADSLMDWDAGKALDQTAIEMLGVVS